ncbi:hypothetical protein OC846_001200 [Tilletia horrida]|uniref:Aquaporin n=1 Tax=Tilletia horrida TaxID=155126 RepID=A0AAN6GWR7_9BASI|nr:hypothetical protein OC845_000230 [Tilletia horrida]KAK0556377.1 hypothetical protein OC846_001200 [Tilletia horrida]KAK0569277.1 hypothetical protein OC861_001092 [Tilletia horrida]
MSDTPASIVVTPPPPSSDLHAAADVAEQINLDLHSAAANATLIPPSIGSSPLSNSPSQTPAQNPALVPGAVPAISLDPDPSPSSANVAPPPPQQSLSGSSTLPSGEAPALIELEPLPDGATQQIPASALGQRNDGAHISIVRDSKGHFFRRIIHSASSSSSRRKKRTAAGEGATSGNSTPSSKKKRHHHRSSQPTYGLGHSRGAPVIIRAGQHGYPYTFPQYQGTASAPVSRMNSRKEGAPAPAPAPRSVHGRESAEITGGGPRSSGTNTPAPPSRRSHEHHHHHRQHAPPRRQDPSQLIGLGRANPLSGLMGSANPNRAFLASASASASPYQALSRTTTGTERRSLDSAPIPHSQAPILSDAEIARIAAALGGGGGLGASPQPQLLPPPNSINPELLTALRDIIRQEVGSAHAVHAEQHQQQIVDEIQALGRDGPVEVEAEAESSPHTDDTLSIPERSKQQQQQQQQQQQRQQQPSDSIRAERGIEDTDLPPLSEKAGLDPPAVAQSDDKPRRSFESGKSSLSSVAAAAGGGGGEGGRRSRTRSISSSIGSHGSSSDGDELEFPNPWAKFRYWMREPFAEFLGTCVFIIFGNGVNNQVFVSQMYDASAPKGDYLSVSFGWGIGVAFGIWIAGGISGGHLNPCVTLALAVYRGFPWRKVPVYIVSQILGATVGALLIYGLYCNPIRVVDPNQTETTAADYLRTPTTRPTAFYNEVLATAVLLIIVLAIGDAANTPPPDGLAPLALMWAVVGLGATLGWQTAYALNIARDLGPRLALQIVGYSPKVLWSFNAYYFLWTPMLGAVVGALLGGFIYDALLYTGGESPLNRQWKWSDVRWARHSKKKLPAGISA